ncbi:MAG: hypothetical protein AABY22_32645 [Nanoarchaeota archaeon]|mgnify:CR=1 FL=1
MKLKTIFFDYAMPDEFWNRLERIFEIEMREAYERGLIDSTKEHKEEVKPLTDNSSVGMKNPDNPPEDIHKSIEKEMRKDYGLKSSKNVGEENE